MRKQLLSLLLLVTLAGGTTHALAASAPQLIRQGNQAYHQGKYEEALKAYDEASVEAPESPYIYFNKGAVYYRQKDYAKAKEAFSKAALKSKDLGLEASSKFNLGNCAFQEMQRQMDSDLQKALKACQTSIRYYQDALELNPKMHEAGENIELARLTAKNLLDQIKKQEEQRKKQQQAQNEAKQKLQELIKRQQAALGHNQALTAKNKTLPYIPKVLDQIKSLSAEQSVLQSDTRNVADDLSKKLKKQMPKAVGTHLADAVSEQGNAVNNLNQIKPQPAQDNQGRALQALQEALKALSANQKQNQKQNQKNNQNQNQNQQQKKGASKPKKSPDKSDQKQPKKDKLEKQNDKKQTTAQIPDDANDIIKEEHENKKHRQVSSGGGYQSVEKDW